jgi:tol-pal system protein YbgF
VEPAVRDYRAALALVRDRDLNEGLTRLRRFVQIYGGHAYADNALFWQGEVLFMQRRYQDALRAYSEVLSRYPRGNKVSDAMLKMARCHQRLGNTSQASSLLQRLRREFPQSVAARIASREERS